MQSRALRLLLVLVVLAGAYLLLWPVPVEPVEFLPSENPGLEGPFRPNLQLAAVEHLAEGIGTGPEDVARGPDGLFYTGLLDGRIVRFGKSGGQPETFASTGGRPLGMQFDASGNLIVADAFKGLLSISPQGAVSLLVDQVGGQPMKFSNDLDIAADGTIWFSDASQRFGVDEWMLDFLEMRPTGRLLSYHPATGRTQVHLQGLYFANGVALSPDGAFVLVNECSAARITRLWLSGPKAGSQDVLIDRLPGYPDNLSSNGRGIFWVALPGKRLDRLESLWPRPFVRKLLVRLRGSDALPLLPYGWVIGVDAQGRVVHNLQDPQGGYATITSVNEFDGWLYPGSLTMQSVGRIAAPRGR